MMGPPSGIRYRKPERLDGARMWTLVRDSGRLDLNSPYSYLMLCEWFADTCVIAEHEREREREHEPDGQLVGMVTGFRQPSNPDTLFVWQIAVADRYRGCGIASDLLDELVANRDVGFVECTISPSNAPSRRLFQKWAATRGAQLTVSGGFGEAAFPGRQHEKEELYRIGPLYRQVGLYEREEESCNDEKETASQ